MTGACVYALLLLDCVPVSLGQTIRSSAVVSPTVLPDGRIRLACPTTAGLWYQLKGAPLADGGGVWTDLGSARLGTGGQAEWWLAGSFLPQYFLRMDELAADPSTNSTPRALASIGVALVDSNAIGYATFQSHNQKVVSNTNGLFATYNRQANANYTSETWRLVRSVDDGATFTTVYEGTDTIHPPDLETDLEGNLYASRTDRATGNAYLYRFAVTNYAAEPRITPITNGISSYTRLLYEPAEDQFIHWVGTKGLYDTFHVMRRDGSLVAGYQLFSQGPGQNAWMAYPHLSRDPGSGVLYASYTTAFFGHYLYWDIHCMATEDSGRTWRKLDGTPLSLPLVPDNTGPTDRVTLDDEFDFHTWLSSSLAKDDKLHFVYWAESNPQKQRYVRLNARTGVREVDVPRLFQRTNDTVMALDGFFASRAALPHATLYFVSSIENETRLACMASDDDGQSWYLYARSEQTFARQKWHGTYAIGGTPELTAEGRIVGTFTHLHTNADSFYEPDSGSVYFLRIQAGLSQATVDNVAFSGGSFQVSFSAERGQPEAVRFRTEAGQWSAFLTYGRQVDAQLSGRPVQYQLRSRLQVLSVPVDLAPIVQ